MVAVQKRRVNILAHSLYRVPHLLVVFLLVEEKHPTHETGGYRGRAGNEVGLAGPRVPVPRLGVASRHHSTERAKGALSIETRAEMKLHLAQRLTRFV